MALDIKGILDRFGKDKVHIVIANDTTLYVEKYGTINPNNIEWDDDNEILILKDRANKLHKTTVVPYSSITLIIFGETL